MIKKSRIKELATILGSKISLEYIKSTVDSEYYNELVECAGYLKTFDKLFKAKTLGITITLHDVTLEEIEIFYTIYEVLNGGKTNVAI